MPRELFLTSRKGVYIIVRFAVSLGVSFRKRGLPKNRTASEAWVIAGDFGPSSGRSSAHLDPRSFLLCSHAQAVGAGSMGRVVGAPILPVHVPNTHLVNNNLNVGRGSAAATADDRSPRVEPIPRHLPEFSCAVVVSKPGSSDPIPSRGVPFLSTVGVCHERYCRHLARFGSSMAAYCCWLLRVVRPSALLLRRVAAAVGALSVLRCSF